MAYTRGVTPSITDSHIYNYTLPSYREKGHGR